MGAARANLEVRREGLYTGRVTGFVCVLVCIGAAAWAAGSNPLIRWNPGIPGGIPAVAVKANVRDFGAAGNGVADDAPAIQKAIDAVDGGAVLIPAGDYVLRKGLTLAKGVVLRGEGPARTRLLFDIEDRAAIRITGGDAGPWTDVVSGCEFGSSRLRVADGSLFKAGDFVQIQQENDADVMYTNPMWKADWAEDSVGQVLRAGKVSGNELTLDGPLHITFQARLRPRIRTQRFVERAGVEDLYVQLSPKGDPVTIGMRNAAYCWARNVESSHTSRGHVNGSVSYRCEIRDSFFHDSHDYGGGGHGYGVDLGRHVTGWLIENNIFQRLRHAMLVQVGASGNVFGYNYSIEPRSQAEWIPCDISLHGHFPFMNLFEGNTAQKVEVGDYWGPAGPGNTFLRNRIEAHGMRIRDHSHGQNVIGNELARAGLEIHESVKGTWVRNTGDGAIPRSLYLKRKPRFFGEMSWPAEGKLPAEVRFEKRAR